MGIGFSELAIILIGVLIVFGAGKLPSVLSDMGKGVKAFKEGMDDKPAKKKPAKKTARKKAK